MGGRGSDNPFSTRTGLPSSQRCRVHHSGERDDLLGWRSHAENRLQGLGSIVRLSIAGARATRSHARQGVPRLLVGQMREFPTMGTTAAVRCAAVPPHGTMLAAVVRARGGGVRELPGSGARLPRARQVRYSGSDRPQRVLRARAHRVPRRREARPVLVVARAPFTLRCRRDGSTGETGMDDVGDVEVAETRMYAPALHERRASSE